MPIITLDHCCKPNSFLFLAFSEQIPHCRVELSSLEEVLWIELPFEGSTFVIQHYPCAAHSTYKVAKLRGGGWRVRSLLSTCSILGLEKVCSDYYPSRCKPTSLCMLGQSVGHRHHTTPQRSRGSHLEPGWLFTSSYLPIRLDSNICFAELFWELRM